MTQLITADLVRLDADLGSDKESVIRSLAALVSGAGRTADVDGLVRDALAREATSPTGLKGGIAIPHCRTAAVSEPTLAFARLSPPVDFGAKDGPADIAFLIAAPEGGDATHLTILTKLARALVKPAFTDGLRSASSAEEVVALVDGVLNPEPAAAPAPANAAPEAAAAPRRSLVAVTACPTGIAHTYMAAEALQAAAELAGVDIHVETQGSAGSTPLAASTIAAASAVILAADVGVRDKGRFAGLPVVATGVKRAVDAADALIAEALRYADDPAAPRVAGGSATSDGAAGNQSGEATESWGGRIRRVLMTGVSYMIPFVAAGGLLIALSFLLGGYDITNVFADVVAKNSLTNLPDVNELGLEHVPFDSGLLAYVAAILFIVGKTAFAFFVPALSGYIAYAIADRPGLAPGFIVGGLATDIMQFGTPQTGFIGAIVGGVLAGLVAHWIAGRKVPTWARGLMPVLVIPLFTTLVVGTLMLTVLGTPISELMTSLQDGLKDMSGSNAIVLGIILGLMMAFDMGGPLNKVAYSFAAAGIGGASLASDAPELKIMAAVMLAGMVPPIALALATVVRPGLFSPAERENGKAAWLLGASFITEGAIPFAAADPLRVIPSIMLGSAVTGGLAQAFDVALRAPHGGIFVLFAVDGIPGFAIALVAGVLVAATSVVLLKSFTRGSDAEVLETVPA
ncbi:PTS fructose transporter subunit IIABC [Nocardioides cavernaquae]|uniref:PTS lactose transporter subunit IIC n=1 Tax=Nocardioides cavernaquae TaxID=2321396 RepID=A0A3A5H4S0_9ACTN|nr:fructose-specific PTS transporter subunit EIIC [Nocardioides cavernaquae]RJS44891.1 PTS lactose transporter subunit IIC [Nocardioides cavernaquae]